MLMTHTRAKIVLAAVDQLLADAATYKETDQFRRVAEERAIRVVRRVMDKMGVRTLDELDAELADEQHVDAEMLAGLADDGHVMTCANPSRSTKQGALGSITATLR